MALQGNDEAGQADKVRSSQKRTDFQAPKSAKVYEITARVRDTHREIWRSVLVVDLMPLSAFHHVLQLLFDWSGYHIYYFERPAKKLFFDDPAAPEVDFEPPKGETHVLASEATVKDLLPKKGSKAVYVYDLGDFWEIDLKVKSSFPLSEYTFPFLPVCADGEGASPLEDVGGPGGYELFCMAMRNPHHERHAEYAEWAGIEEGEAYDEALFDIRDVNTAFADAMIAANPQMIPSDPDELRKEYAMLLADQFVLEVEMQFAAAMMMEAIGDMADEL